MKRRAERVVVRERERRGNYCHLLFSPSATKAITLISSRLGVEAQNKKNRFIKRRGEYVQKICVLKMKEHKLGQDSSHCLSNCYKWQTAMKSVSIATPYCHPFLSLSRTALHDCACWLIENGAMIAQISMMSSWSNWLRWEVSDVPCLSLSFCNDISFSGW